MVGGFDPFEGLGVLVVLVDEGFDVRDQIVDAATDAALDLLFGAS